MLEIERKLVELERKLARVTDELELTRITASIAPSVDSLSADIAARLWTEDGVYDVPGVGCWTGHDELRAFFSGEQLRAALSKGAAHVLSSPRIVIDGNIAAGTCYSFLCRKSEKGVEVLRLAANRIEFRRTNEGWRISKRTVLDIDGSEGTRTLLGATFSQSNGV